MIPKNAPSLWLLPIKSLFHRLSKMDVWLGIVLFIYMTLLSIIYVAHEHAFYYWDYSGYQAMSLRAYLAWQTSFAAGVKSIIASLGSEYNYLFTLPLTLLYPILGHSRLTYILGIVWFYQFPYALCIGAIAKNLAKQRKHLMFWLATWIVALTPMAWAPTLRGYPDIAAASFVALACLLFIKDVNLKSISTYLGIGFALAAAALLRRHFIYDILVFYATVGLWKLFVTYREGYPSSQTLAGRLLNSIKMTSRKMFLLGFSITIFMATLGLPLLIKVLHNNYPQLYLSYEINSAQTFLAYIEYFGVGTWILCLSGFGVTLLSEAYTHYRASSLFLAMFGLLNMATWILVVKNAATHYTLHFLIFITLGIALLLHRFIVPQAQKHMVRFALGMISWLIINLIYSLASPINAPAGFMAVFSKKYTPLYRSDYSEIVAMIAHLRERTTPEQPIYVAAASGLLNDDLLKNAEEVLYGSHQLNFLKIPVIDSRDEFPLEDLLSAQWVLITDPVEYGIRNPNEQKVVSSVVEAFIQGWEIAGSFELEPVTWQLSDGASVRLYHRSHPTNLQVALQTYTRLTNLITRRPQSQPSWVAHQQNGPEITETSSNFYHLQVKTSANSSDPEQGWFYLYTGPPSPTLGWAGTWSYSGSSTCPPTVITAELYNDQGLLMTSSHLATALPNNEGNLKALHNLPSRGWWVLHLATENKLAIKEQQDCSLQVALQLFPCDLEMSPCSDVSP